MVESKTYFKGNAKELSDRLDVECKIKSGDKDKWIKSKFQPFFLFSFFFFLADSLLNNKDPRPKFSTFRLLYQNGWADSCSYEHYFTHEIF